MERKLEVLTAYRLKETNINIQENLHQEEEQILMLLSMLQ